MVPIPSCSWVIEGRRDSARCRALFPAQEFLAVVALFHGDALLDWADQRTEVATHAIFLDDGRHAAAIGGEGDRLVGAVVTGGVAELATDALGGVDLGDDFVFEIEFLPLHLAGQCLATHLRNIFEALLVHVALQARQHLADDAKTVVHHSRADLQRARTQ